MSTILNKQFRAVGVSKEVAAELSRAMSMFPVAMNSPHEAKAVIEEEFDEYWDEVKMHNTSKPDRDTRPRQRAELIQLAAMAIRAIIETIDIPLDHTCPAVVGGPLVGDCVVRPPAPTICGPAEIQ